MKLSHNKVVVVVVVVVVYDVRMAQFVLKIEKMSHIIGVRGS